MITVILPAYNEQLSISCAIHSIYAQLPTSLPTEVIVVASACTDETIDVVKGLQQHYSSLALLVEEERRGKASALRMAKDMAKGHLLILTDADIVWDPGTLIHLLEHFRDPAVGAVCARVAPRDSSDNVFALLARIRCDVWHKLRMADSTKNCLTMPSGYLYAIRRFLFANLPTDIVADDAYMGVALVRTGYRLTYEPQAVVRPCFPDNLRDFLQQRIRNQLGRIQLRRIAPTEISRVCRALLRESVREVLVNSNGLRPVAILHLALEIMCRVAAERKYSSVGPYVPWAPIMSTKAPPPSGQKPPGDLGSLYQIGRRAADEISGEANGA